MSKTYNLEARTLEFTKGIIELCGSLSKNTINFKLIGQLVNSAGSVGANYREANEKLGKKDFQFRLKIARKECKEATYWLELLKGPNSKRVNEIDVFIKESIELRNILSAIIDKAK